MAKGQRVYRGGRLISVETVADRYWKLVEKRDGCWAWKGTTSGNGYGQLRLDKARGFRKTVAHRVSWEIHNGPIPEGMWVLHRCDNPPCSNPTHLFLGDAKDNARDRQRKRRGRKQDGALNHQALLRPDDIAEIRRLYAGGFANTSEIGPRFGVIPQAIQDILRGRKWASVPIDPLQRRIIEERLRHRGRLLSEVKVPYRSRGR